MPSRHSGLFSWLNDWRRDELRGRLVEIFIAPAAGAPMQRCDLADCVPGQGLSGDRYAARAGHWRLTDACEVTLVTREDLQRAARRGPDLGDGWHRRNLVVAGIPLAAFRRHRVRVGEVWFEFHRLRPPCAYLDRVSGPGAARALGKGGGIGLRVVSAGVIRVGDEVELSPPDPPRDAHHGRVAQSG